MGSANLASAACVTFEKTRAVNARNARMDVAPTIRYDLAIDIHACLTPEFARIYFRQRLRSKSKAPVRAKSAPPKKNRRRSRKHVPNLDCLRILHAEPC